MDVNKQGKVIANNLQRRSNFYEVSSENRNSDMIYKSILALTSESLLRDFNNEKVKIDTKGIVFDNLILVVLEELQEQNPQLKDEIEKLSDSHKQNIVNRDYHAFSIAKKLNLPKRFVMYMNKAQEWGLEKELIYLIMAGYDEDTTWKLLVGYEEWATELCTYASTARDGLPPIEEYIRWKTTGEVIKKQTLDDALDDVLSDILD